MSVNIRWAIVPRHRRMLLAAAIAVCLLGFGARVSGQTPANVNLVQDDTCPLSLSQVQVEPRLRSLDLTISGTIANPGRRPARGVVFTAALVDETGRVRNLHLQALNLAVDGGEKRTFRVVFERFAAAGLDRIVFGIQAVRWSRTEEWRGALKVVSAPAVLASNGVAR